MYKMLIAICFILYLGSILAPDSGRAQTGDNEFGLYTDPSGDPASVNVEATVGESFNIYLVLTNPVNPNFNGYDNSRPVALVGGWEAKIISPANFIINNTVFPVGGVNIGVYPSYTVGLLPIPVIDNAITLMTMTGVVSDTAPTEFYLGVAEPASVAGVMVYLDAEDRDGGNRQTAWPSSGSFDAPVFSINNPGAVVATENESWGDLKALYR